MADPTAADTYLGEFRRGPAIFTVFRTAPEPPAFRVDCNDGNGPSEVCTFSDRPGSGPKWHGAWNGDEWCAWIELQARTIARLPLPRPDLDLDLGHGARQDRCQPVRHTASPRPTEGPAGRPAPPRGRTAGHRPGRSVGIGRASLPGNPTSAGELL